MPQDDRSAQAHVQAAGLEFAVRLLGQVHHQAGIDAAVAPHALDERAGGLDDHAALGHDLDDGARDAGAQLDAGLTHLQQDLSAAGRDHASLFRRTNRPGEHAAARGHFRAGRHLVAHLAPDQPVGRAGRQAQDARHVDQHMFAGPVGLRDHIRGTDLLVHARRDRPGNGQHALAHDVGEGQDVMDGR
jgi:hypothetical protein